MREETLYIYSTIKIDEEAAAITYPVFYTSTYYQEEPGKTKGFEYSRTSNPTRLLLEKSLATIESAQYGYAFSSGMAAIDAVIHLLDPGDVVLCSDDLYGGTFRIFQGVYQKYDINFIFEDLTNPNNIENIKWEKIKMVWLESPTNPLLKVIDIKKICDERSKKNPNCLVVVDNTFATPYLQKPITLGADIVVHSLTKYLGGHSDIVMGTVITNSITVAQKIQFIQNSVGAVPSPMDCFLALRGIKTLHIRMERHSLNAEFIANNLINHPKIKKLYYPFVIKEATGQIKSIELARQQMKMGGGMLSVEIDCNEEEVIKILKKLKLFKVGESLGGVESLVCRPAVMTHSWLPENIRIQKGITNSLLRFSVGIENKEDLLEDILNALK